MEAEEILGETTLTKRSQATIPKQVREELGLQEKGRVAFVRVGKEIVIRKIPESFVSEMVESARGKLKRKTTEILREIEETWR